MRLHGAGVSASAEIPTAWDRIWEFKQQIYVSKRRDDPKAVSDLSNPSVRRLYEEFIVSVGIFPEPKPPEEYAALFEAVYPSEMRWTRS